MRRLFSFSIKGLIFGGVCFLVIFLQRPDYLFAKESAIEDVRSLFPKSVSEIVAAADEGINLAKREIQQILAIPDSQRTFADTVKKFDDLISFSSLSKSACAIHILEMVSPDEAIRNAARETIIRIQDFFIDSIGNNLDLYKAFKAYYEGNAGSQSLTQKQRYYLDQMMLSFKHNGFDLPEEKREEVKKLNKELAQLSLQFSANIAADQTKISVQESELKGLSQDFIASLEKDSSGYVLGIDAPTYQKVMNNCVSPETRERMYTAYMNKAYPVNDGVLKEIIAKRDRLARLIGFESYAAYSIDSEMAKTPERVRTFLDDLIVKVAPKADEEAALLIKELPFSVALSSDGKPFPRDKLFLEDQYKKKYLQIDEEKISEYFPVEKTIRGLISIYEKFFSLRMVEKKAEGLWHEDVRLLEVYSQKTGSLLGCLLLDLFPRPFKFGHACDINIIPAVYHNKEPNVAVSLVITNFPKPEGDKPALLERSHVQTFFHEFGHAMHDLLGRTELAGTSGTSVKTDFVEMPSQMLEEWLSDRQILAMISSHYRTGEPMPEALIDRIVAVKNFDAGLWMQRQLQFASLSLDLFGPGEQKDPYEISKRIQESMNIPFVFDPANHMYASFGHLTGYGAKYYGYLWAKVFALDLFAFIKEKGLLDPSVGERYIQEVIGQGGSVDPNVLLQNFLGREPNNVAFLKDMGILE